MASKDEKEVRPACFGAFVPIEQSSESEGSEDEKIKGEY